MLLTLAALESPLCGPVHSLHRMPTGCSTCTLPLAEKFSRSLVRCGCDQTRSGSRSVPLLNQSVGPLLICCMPTTAHPAGASRRWQAGFAVLDAIMVCRVVQPCQVHHWQAAQPMRDTVGVAPPHHPIHEGHRLGAQQSGPCRVWRPAPTALSPHGQPCAAVTRRLPTRCACCCGGMVCLAGIWVLQGAAASRELGQRLRPFWGVAKYGDAREACCRRKLAVGWAMRLAPYAP